MQKFPSILLLTLISTAACTHTPATVSNMGAQLPTAEAPVEFKRGNIVVADIDRSLTIYRDILGFSVDKISKSTNQSYSYPVFEIPKEATLRFATLSTPTQTRTLAMTEITGIELQKPTPPHMATNVIRVSDMESVMKKIEALGLKTVREERSTTPEGISFLERAFVDFDGHLVVLYELL